MLNKLYSSVRLAAAVFPFRNHGYRRSDFDHYMFAEDLFYIRNQSHKFYFA